RPREVAGLEIPAEAAGEAQPLGLGQVGFTAPEGLVGVLQLQGALGDHALQVVVGTMERLFRLPTHGNLTFEPDVLSGELLEHAVDSSREGVNLVRAAAHGDPA